MNNGQIQKPEHVDGADPNLADFAGPTSLVTGPDPFDVESLRLAGDVSLVAKKTLLSLHVGRPNPSWWVRVHPAESHRLKTGMIEAKVDSKFRESIYLVVGNLQGELDGDPCFRTCILTTAVTRQGLPFLWLVKLQRDGQMNKWSSAVHAAMQIAMKKWIRIAWNDSTHADEIWEGSSTPEPTFAEMTLSDLLRVGFGDRIIRSLDDPIVKQLRGWA